MPEIKAALLRKGYIFVGIGGGVTGDIQINDTDLHSPLKAKHRVGAKPYNGAIKA